MNGWGALVIGVAVLMAARVPPHVKSAWAAITGTSPTSLRLVAGWGPDPVAVTSRAVVVNPARLEPLLPPPPGRRVATMYLLAHELAHDPRNPDDLVEELEADRRAGATLRRAGITERQIRQYVIPMLEATAPSSTHGNPRARVRAVLAGWAG